MPLSPPLRVTPVRTTAEHRAFWTLPYRLYRDMPQWAAPLRRDERRRWNPTHNPSLAGRTVWRLVAWRGRRPVGRIAAFLDPVLAERWAPGTGGFGFFESVEDAEVSSSLFEAAEGILRAEGARRVLGPVNLTFHDEMGLLVDGFDAPPSLLTPFNPAYYPSLIERQGYRPRFDQHAYRWTVGATLHPAVERAARRVAAGGIMVRPFRPGDWDREVRLLHALYNEAFDGTWGFVPIGWEDFRSRAEGFRAWYRPELVRIAELRARPIGFILALPELSPLLARIRGRLWPFGAPYLAVRAPAVRRARLMLLGVLPEFTARGVAAALAAELVSVARRLGLSGGELSLVHESNRAVRHMIEACGGAPSKRFRVYQKELQQGDGGGAR